MYGICIKCLLGMKKEFFKLWGLLAFQNRLQRGLWTKLPMAGLAVSRAARLLEASCAEPGQAGLGVRDGIIIYTYIGICCIVSIHYNSYMLDSIVLSCIMLHYYTVCCTIIYGSPKPPW